MNKKVQRYLSSDPEMALHIAIETAVSIYFERGFQVTRKAGRLMASLEGANRTDLEHLAYVMETSLSAVSRLAASLTPWGLVYFDGWAENRTIELTDKGRRAIKDAYLNLPVILEPNPRYKTGGYWLHLSEWGTSEITPQLTGGSRGGKVRVNGYYVKVPERFGCVKRLHTCPTLKDAAEYIGACLAQLYRKKLFPESSQGNPVSLEQGACQCLTQGWES